MTVTACLLRGVNVGGKGRIKMAELRALFEQLGYGNPRTLLQSGNVVFDGKGSAAAIANKIAVGIMDSFGFEPAIIIRTLSELKDALAHNPFRIEAKKDPSHMLIMFLAEKPVAGAAAKLAELDIAPEAARLGRREVYLWYPGGIGTSKKLARVPIEKLLGTQGTARNIRTVEALIDLAEAG
jgi:uncharacterized protein (DUF1697 family)